MQPLSNSFRKSERLCSKKQIEQLFTNGSSFIAFPLRIQFLLMPAVDDSPHKALFSVPKKRFKRAVKRNLIRRRMREAFRLNKHLLCDTVESGQQLVVAFIYLDKEIDDYTTIEKGMIKAFEKLKQYLIKL